MSTTLSSTMRPKPDFAAATALAHLAMAPSTADEELIPIDAVVEKLKEKKNDEGAIDRSFKGKNAKFPMKVR